MPKRKSMQHWAKFECKSCGDKFHILRKYNGVGQWVRDMPPKYCPGCGVKVVEE